MKLNPYLIFDGQCKAAFEFYERALGGKIEAIVPVKGSPAEDHMGPGSEDRTLHACMTIAGTTVMGSDCPAGQGEKPQAFSINIGVNSPEEAERLFNALAENGQVTMPLEKTFWARKFGMLTDQFGTPWMINCE